MSRAGVAGAARRGGLPDDALARGLLAHPAVALGTVALAAGEMIGDKLASAPDRIILPGLVARSVTAAFAGAVLAPKEQRKAAAALAAAAAVGASFLGFGLRVAAMRRFGQASTGFVEDAVVLGSGLAIANGKQAAPRPR